MFSKNQNKSISSAVKYIVVGLGNPGSKYTFTRHNVGFLSLDFISQSHNFKIDNVKFKSFSGRKDFVSTDGEKFNVLFLKPNTYMNNSGEAVNEAARFYKVPSENIIVVFDDISLPVGKIRIRRSGSDGGHNGIKSIIYHLRSDAFPRVKIGVGNKPHPDFELADWVLSTFSTNEQKIIFDTFPKVKLSLEEIIQNGDIDAAMNKFNANNIDI